MKIFAFVAAIGELSLLTLPLTTRLRSFAAFDLEADNDEGDADIPKADLAFGELFLEILPIFRTFDTP